MVDERPYAQLAARQYGAQHYETTISPDAFRDFLPNYVWHMEEPICEPPAIALYYVTKLARTHVKVLLSGEGGDEAFAGYQNYRNLVWLERLKASGGLLKGLAGFWGDRTSKSRLGRKLARYVPLIDLPLRDYYYSRTSTPFDFFNNKRDEFLAADFRRSVSRNRSLAYVNGCFDRQQGRSTLTSMLYVDTKTWLPDDLLVKADKMTMANSVELRVPLLDHKVLEFAASLPASFKLHGLSTKHVLKKALRRRVSAQIINRRKTGFPVPVHSWIHGPLQISLATSCWTEGPLRGVFCEGCCGEPEFRRRRHQLFGREIFSLLVLELWHRQFVDSSDSAPALR